MVPVTNQIDAVMEQVHYIKWQNPKLTLLLNMNPLVVEQHKVVLVLAGYQKNKRVEHDSLVLVFPPS